MNRLRHYIPCACLLFASTAWACSEKPAAQVDKVDADAAAEPSMIRGEDGCIDLSNFIDKAYGFMPLAIPITEPAVGLGAVAGLAFIDRKPDMGQAGFGRPNISLVGGLATENGTEGYFGGDMRYWLDDRLQTLIGAVKTTVNLDYYGSGRQGFNNDNPQSYTLDLTGLTAQARYRMGDTPNWLGMSYLNAESSVSFDNGRVLPLTGHEMRISGVGLAFNHDTRDNMFTPRDGNYFEASATFFDEDLGSDLDFTRYSITGMQYLPLDRTVSLGLRESFVVNSGDTPFYMQPFVYMRGVPAMRYLGEKVAQVEAEAFWRAWQRVSLVGFAGAGVAAGEFHDMSRSTTVVAGGAGVRYEIAQKYGMHMGLDVAWSRDGPAVYVQFGSAWMRP